MVNYVSCLLVGIRPLLSLPCRQASLSGFRSLEVGKGALYIDLNQPPSGLKPQRAKSIKAQEVKNENESLI